MSKYKNEILTSYYQELLEVPEDLDWLDLKNIPDQVYNPLLDYNIETYNENPEEDMVRIIVNTEYIHFAAKFILNVDLLPFQLAILDVFWHKRYPMLVASRGCGKTFLLAVYALLRMILEPGCKIVGVGAGLRQSRHIYDYMAKIWESAPILRDISGKGSDQGPRREVDRFQFKVGESVAVFIPLGQGDKIRGMRANYVLIDEFHSVPEEIVNIVVRGFAVVNPNPIDRVKTHFRKQKLKEQGLWSETLEMLEKEGLQKNQIVYSGTAYYSFNHFYKYFARWKRIIASQGNKKVLEDIFGDDRSLMDHLDWRDYAIVRIPYTAAPKGILDESMIADAKMNMTSAQFDCEYSAIFALDSDGFYKRSILEACTTNKPIIVNGNKIQFSIMKEGNKEKRYILGIDPAADRDNAAIVVLELNDGYRKIVNCWTTNRKKYGQLKRFYSQRNISIEDDYYQYIARKVRELMSLFYIEHIIMDKNGGGIAIAEALGSQRNLLEKEPKILPIIELDDPKGTDGEEGLHILQLLNPTSEINSEANHGMLKDFQDKILLFPMVDIIELAKAIEIDTINENEVDTYEDLINEINELKNEISSITVTPSSTLGKETFDTPRAKGEAIKKGYLRKDRFSALLYANYYARNLNKSDSYNIKYNPVGTTKEMRKARGISNEGQMYVGVGLAGIKDTSWLKSKNYKAIHK